MPETPALRGPLLTLGLIGAGAVIGAGHLHPGLAVLAWVGVALMGLLLARAEHAGWVAAGLLLGGLAEMQAAHPWHVTFLTHYVPGGQAVSWPLTQLFHAGVMLPERLALLVGWLLGRRFGWPVVAWFPLAWWMGEAINDAFSGISHGAWLYSQWQVEPMLRAVGHLGWAPALLLALAIAVSAGEALAHLAPKGARESGTLAGSLTRRSRGLALVAGGGLLVLCGLPPLAKADARSFAGVGVVHTGARTIRPSEAPAGVELLIWPEGMLRRALPMSEAAPTGRLKPPVSGLSHVIGAYGRTRDGLQNSLVGLAPDGRVTGMRAKRRLFALSERRVFGLALGATTYEPGAAAPIVEAGGRNVLGLICVEASDGALVAEGRRAGAELIAIAADETALHGSAVAGDQMLATAVMRAVEFRLPVARAAINGPAALILPDGRVIAASKMGTHGILTATGDLAFGPRPYVAPPPGARDAPLEAAVLYSKSTPAMLAALPGDRARHFPIEHFENPGVRARTVVLAGHSAPPRYLDQPVEQVAQAIASFQPELVVLDTCFGASTPILEAFAQRGLKAVVVAPPYRIPRDGFVYEAGFFAEPDADRRARLVRTEPSFPLLRWRPDGPALATLSREVAGLDARALRAKLHSVTPPLVKIALPGEAGPGAEVLMPVGAERFRPKP